jgi:AP-1 complex subunit beta-1
LVVANAVAALAEIQDSSVRPVFEITSHTLSKLLTALNECTEYATLLAILGFEFLGNFTKAAPLTCW